ILERDEIEEAAREHRNNLSPECREPIKRGEMLLMEAIKDRKDATEEVTDKLSSLSLSIGGDRKERRKDEQIGQEENSHSTDTIENRDQNIENAVGTPLLELTKESFSSFSSHPRSFGEERKKETDSQENQDGTNEEQKQGSFSFRTLSGAEVRVQ